MKINAIMERKAPRILTDSYTVGDVIVLTEKEYFSLYNNLLRDRDYFEERKHMDYDSILILGEGQKDGILVDPQGWSYWHKTDAGKRLLQIAGRRAETAKRVFVCCIL